MDTHTLKMFDGYTKLGNIEVVTVFDENDLQDLELSKLKEGDLVAVCTYQDKEFFCANAIRIKSIKDNIYLDNGQCFNKNGAEIR